MRVVCAGHVNWDVTLRVDRLPAPDDEARVRERTETGGSAANVAAALAGLDREVRLFGSVGGDAGSAVRTELRRAGVKTRLRTVAGAATTRKYLLVDDSGEVAVLGTGGADEALSAADVLAAASDDADALHLTGQDPETAAVLAATAADRGLTVSFDPGRRLADRDYGDVVDHVDLLFASEREAAATATLAWTVTTRGNRGATLGCPEGRFDHPGYDLDGPPIDAAGAGDAFAAGFLAVRIADGDPERALSVANACGALAAGERGPRPDLSWERVERVVS